MSHRSHRFTQISSLQATVVTMPHSNRYFSARELRIFFRNTNCTNYTNKLLSLERFVFNTQYYSFKSHTDLTDLTDFFRCKQRFVYHQDCVSTIFQVVTPISFFEKSYFCIVLQKISCTRQFERQLSLRSLASLFPIKEGIFLPLRLSCKESSTS